MAIKNNKDGMEYEDVEFKYTKEEQGSGFVDDIGYLLTVGANTLRQSSSVAVQHLRRNDMGYIVLILLTSIWLSGWFANSGDAFLSLLSVVLGVVISIGLSLISNKENK